MMGRRKFKIRKKNLYVEYIRLIRHVPIICHIWQTIPLKLNKFLLMTPRDWNCHLIFPHIFPQIDISSQMACFCRKVNNIVLLKKVLCKLYNFLPTLYNTSNKDIVFQFILTSFFSFYVSKSSSIEACSSLWGRTLHLMLEKLLK